MLEVSVRLQGYSEIWDLEDIGNFLESVSRGWFVYNPMRRLALGGGYMGIL